VLKDIFTRFGILAEVLLAYNIPFDQIQDGVLAEVCALFF